MTDKKILKYADRDKAGKIMGFAHEVFKRPPPKTDCKHEEFESWVEVNRLIDRDPIVFMAEVKIECVQCKAPFRFKGLPGGLNFEKPMCSAEGHEARLPIEPSSHLDTDGAVSPPSKT